jgi:uncharacterized Zn-finger protein
MVDAAEDWLDFFFEQGALDDSYAQKRRMKSDLDFEAPDLDDELLELESESYTDQTENGRSGNVNIFQQLKKCCACPPAPDSLDDWEFAEQLNKLVDDLADLNVFLVHTDHLSDKRLYKLLWKNELKRPYSNETKKDDAPLVLDMCPDDDPKEVNNWLSYYADDEQRKAWAEEHSDKKLPLCKKLPYKRDENLPQPRE